MGISNLGRNSEGNYYERLNYAIGERYEPGSIFKLMTLIAALEDGVVKHTDSVDTKNGRLKIKGKEVIDSNRKGYGKITIAKAFEVSSNTGMVKMVYDNYKSKPERFVNRLYNIKHPQKKLLHNNYQRSNITLITELSFINYKNNLLKIIFTVIF